MNMLAWRLMNAFKGAIKGWNNPPVSVLIEGCIFNGGNPDRSPIVTYETAPNGALYATEFRLIGARIEGMVKDPYAGTWRQDRNGDLTFTPPAERQP